MNAYLPILLGHLVLEILSRDGKKEGRASFSSSWSSVWERWFLPWSADLMSCCSILRSVLSSHTGITAVPQTCQAQPNLRDFAQVSPLPGTFLPQLSAWLPTTHSSLWFKTTLRWGLPWAPCLTLTSHHSHTQHTWSLWPSSTFIPRCFSSPSILYDLLTHYVYCLLSVSSS